MSRYNLRSRKCVEDESYDPSETIMETPSTSEEDELSSEVISAESDESTLTEYDEESDSFVVSDDSLEVLKDYIRDRAQKHMDQKYLDLESDGWDDFMASEYMQGGWQDDIDVSEEKMLELETKLDEIIDEMRKESPNVQKILESDLTRDEMKGALFKLDVLQNMDSADLDYGKLRRDIMRKLETRHPLVQKFLADKKRTWEERIMELDASDKIKGTLIVLANQLGDVDDSEYQSKFNKLEKLVKLPYDRVVKPKTDDMELSDFLLKASDILDSELYKMDSVKKKILGVMASYARTGVNKGCVIGLVGDPGVGKTHISRVIAKCLGVPFGQITLGSSDDLTTLLGSDNTWVGSSCGELANAYIKMGCSNGVICIDELDKSGRKIWNAMNHINDPETNHEIKDSYLRDVPIDCSRTIFVESLNNIELLPKYLLSRMVMIHVPPQTLEDKIVITKKYKVPKMKFPEGITFSDDAIRAIVRLSDEKGYREINSYLTHIVESLSMHVIMMGKDFKHCPIKNFSLPFVVTPDHIRLMTEELKEPQTHLTMFV